MNAKLFENDSIITSLVTDTYYLNFEDIRRKNEFIERYVILDYIIRECPDTVEEFDYIIYVINDVDIVNIETLAPGLDELMITMDENNYPKIFLGITSDETDEFRENSKKQEDYLTASDDVTTRLYKAWESDAALFEFVQRLYETN